MCPHSLETEGDRFVIVKRHFAAPPEALYRAHTEREQIQRWMLGAEGWTMPFCLHESKVGGNVRYEWRNGAHAFSLTGEILALDPPHKIIHVERMHVPDATPDSHVETTFVPDATGTLMICRMTVLDEETRTMMVSSGLNAGMERSYQRLDASLSST
jgi:uncharacterized protein YndB with AHSA1/START domain